MANIKLKDIGTSDLDNHSLKQDYLYKDIMLDLSPQYTYNGQLNKSQQLRDMDALYDVEAIRNSVVNCFLTSPGDKILNPTFGIDLRRYLFDPVDTYNTELIREDILVDLPNMEPRIILENVIVEADEENQQYYIMLQINIPSLNVYGLSLKGELNNNGYTLV